MTFGNQYFSFIHSTVRSFNHSFNQKKKEKVHDNDDYDDDDDHDNDDYDDDEYG